VTTKMPIEIPFIMPNDWEASFEVKAKAASKISEDKPVPIMYRGEQIGQIDGYVIDCMSKEVRLSGVVWDKIRWIELIAAGRTSIEIP